MEFASRMKGMSGSAIRAIFGLISQPGMISFAGGNPSEFPELSEIAAEVLANPKLAALQYGATPGVSRLREDVMAMLNIEGFSPKPEEIIIISGAGQGIELMARVFVETGDVVLVEDPTFIGALQTFKLADATPIGVKMDNFGLDIADLEQKILEHKPKFLYTIPTFQNPSGVTMSEERRREVVKTCEKHGVLILEDDPYAALRYSGQNLPSLKSFDTSDSVVRLVSFSKMISPGLRVGFAHGNEQIISKFNIVKQSLDLHTSNLSQEICSSFIRKGLLFPHLEKVRAVYGAKLELMFSLTKRYLPQAKIVKPDGGMFLWCEFADGVDCVAKFDEAISKKVAYVPGTHFYTAGRHKNTLRLNFTMPPEDKFETGMRALAEVFTGLPDF